MIASMLEGNAYGSEIRERVEEFGISHSSLDTLYRTLHVMEAEGLIFSVRKSSEVLLSRRRFEPTEAGEAYLEFWAHSLAQQRKEIDGFLSVYESLNGPENSSEAFRTFEGGADGS
jgi:DNA-binding PadR family transcriptional regulator